MARRPDTAEGGFTVEGALSGLYRPPCSKDRHPVNTGRKPDGLDMQRGVRPQQVLFVCRCRGDEPVMRVFRKLPDDRFHPSGRSRGVPVIDTVECFIEDDVQPLTSLSLKRHLDIVAGALSRTETAALAEVVVELVPAGRGRGLHRVVGTVHKAVLAVEAEAATEAA